MQSTPDLCHFFFFTFFNDYFLCILPVTHWKFLVRHTIMPRWLIYFACVHWPNGDALRVLSSLIMDCCRMAKSSRLHLFRHTVLRHLDVYRETLFFFTSRPTDYLANEHLKRLTLNDMADPNFKTSDLNFSTEILYCSYVRSRQLYIARTSV